MRPIILILMILFTVNIGYSAVLFEDKFNRADNTTGVGNDWYLFNPAYEHWTIHNNMLVHNDTSTSVGNVHLMRDTTMTTNYKSFYIKLRRIATYTSYRFVGYTGSVSSLGTNAFWMQFTNNHKMTIDGGATGGGQQATGHTIVLNQWQEILIHFYHNNQTLDYHWKNDTGQYSALNLWMKDKTSRNVNTFGWFDEQASTPKMYIDIIGWYDDYIDFPEECFEDISYTSWSDYSKYNSSHYSRERIQYDSNECGTFENVTLYEYIPHLSGYLYCEGIDSFTLANNVNYTIEVLCHANFSDSLIKNFSVEHEEFSFINDSIMLSNFSYNITILYDDEIRKNHYIDYIVCSDYDFCVEYEQVIRTYIPIQYDMSRFTEGKCPLDEEQSYILGLFLIFSLLLVGFYLNMTRIKIPFFSAFAGLVVIVMSIPFYACSTFTGIGVSSVGLLFILWEMFEWFR